MSIFLFHCFDTVVVNKSIINNCHSRKIWKQRKRLVMVSRDFLFSSSAPHRMIILLPYPRIMNHHCEQEETYSSTDFLRPNSKESLVKIEKIGGRVNLKEKDKIWKKEDNGSPHVQWHFTKTTVQVCKWWEASIKANMCHRNLSGKCALCDRL